MILSYHNCQAKVSRLYRISSIHEHNDCACVATHFLHVGVHQKPGGWLQVRIKIHKLGHSILWADLKLLAAQTTATAL